MFGISSKRLPDETLGVERAVKFFRMKDLAIRTHLVIGHTDDELKSAKINFPSRLLGDLPMLETIELHSSAVDGPRILAYLSIPRQDENGKLAWPCPLLDGLYVHSQACRWEKLLSFLKNRYARGDGRHPEWPVPPRLKSISFLGRRPRRDQLAHVVGVKTLIFAHVDEPPIQIEY